MADYYGDDEGAEPRPGPDTAPAEAGAADKDESESQTALIPKSLGRGKPFEVGDEIVLEIVGVHEAEYEVKYAEGGKDEETAEPETAEKPQSSRWDSMMD